MKAKEVPSQKISQLKAGKKRVLKDFRPDYLSPSIWEMVKAKLRLTLAVVLGVVSCIVIFKMTYRVRRDYSTYPRFAALVTESAPSVTIMHYQSFLFQGSYLAMKKMALEVIKS